MKTLENMFLPLLCLCVCKIDPTINATHHLCSRASSREITICCNRVIKRAQTTRTRHRSPAEDSSAEDTQRVDNGVCCAGFSSPAWCSSTPLRVPHVFRLLCPVSASANAKSLRHSSTQGFVERVCRDKWARTPPRQCSCCFVVLRSTS